MNFCTVYALAEVKFKKIIIILKNYLIYLLPKPCLCLSEAKNLCYRDPDSALMLDTYLDQQFFSKLDSFLRVWCLAAGTYQIEREYATAD